MSKKKLAETSLEAWQMVTLEMIHGHHKRIIDALKSLGTANCDAIATYAFMNRHQVGKRMNELEKIEYNVDGKKCVGMVYKPGTKSPTPSGRNAYDYCLKITGEKVSKKTEKAMPGKSISDFSKELIQQKMF